ncbi:MAG: type II secretion system protein [Candidatus Paceibacterota bacterium]
MFKKAFTLIELLVVLSIVGILAGFVFVQTNNAVNSGKDAKRKSDIALLASAAVGYQSESISMPISSGCSINVDCPTEINQALEGQLGTLPTDPNSGSSYRYQSDTGTDCTISAVLSTGETYQYSCNGDEMSQSAPLAGVCGSRANNSSSGYPSSQTDWTTDTTYCASTIPSTTPAYPSTPGSSVSWTCPGTYLGDSVTCTAYRALDGVCGSGTANTYTIPTNNFCSTGTASSVSGEGPWNWTCAGVYGGTTPTCVANKSIDGVCGTSNNGNYYDTSSIAAPCSIGATSAYSGSGPWNWTCAGVYSGITPTCTANKKVDGVCTTGLTYYTTPSSGSCTAGTATPVAGTGPWTWSCTGVNSGATSGTCTANKKIDGVCGSSNGAYLPSPPTSNLCSPGTASTSGSWTWSCTGVNSGSSSGTCTAYQKQSCSALGGTMTDCGGVSCCRLPLSSCPGGWSFAGYTTTTSGGGFACPGGDCYSCAIGSGGIIVYGCGLIDNCYRTGSHSWSNISYNSEWAFMNYACHPQSSQYKYSIITEIGCY